MGGDKVKISTDDDDDKKSDDKSDDKSEDAKSGNANDTP
jgi:hypothetical protein